MKRIFCAITSVLFITGCTKIMHQEDTSIGKIQSYQVMVSATNGMYGKLAEAFNSSETKAFNPIGYPLYIANLKGDDLNVNESFYSNYYEPSPQQCYNPDIHMDDAFIYDAWKKLYKVVASANNIIHQKNKIQDLGKKARESLGEAYLMRAYCYFRLVRTYGRIPIVDNTEISYDLPKATFLEIYQFIEHDLQLAGEMLPDNNDQARIPYVTPNRGAAKAMLAEVYLTWAGYPIKDRSKYALAAKEAGDVIDSASYFGFGLVDDFAWLWDKAHYYNKESVFSLYFANPDHTTIIAEPNNVYMGLASVYNGGELTTNYLFTNLNTQIEPYFYPTEINFFNNYPRGYRKDITFFDSIYVPEYYRHWDYDSLLQIGYIHIDSIDPCQRIAYRKFYYKPTFVPYNQYRNQDYLINSPIIDYLDDCFGSSKVYIYRFAQTMLTYAEAAARSGQPDQKAYECVNEIRRRAHHLDLYKPSVYDLQSGLSPEVFADSVVWERAWELAGELEGRWFDLVRLEKVEDLPELTNPKEDSPPDTYDKSAYFFPAPQYDIDLDPNLGE